MGRVYRGIQLVSPSASMSSLGDPSNATDNVPMTRVEGLGIDNNGHPITADDRWVFTEDNPRRELYIAAGLAAGSRAMKPVQSRLMPARRWPRRGTLAGAIDNSDDVGIRVLAMAELIRTTNDPALVRRLVAMRPAILAHVDRDRPGRSRRSWTASRTSRLQGGA